MREVVIQIPDFNAEQNIEIEVKINGKKKVLEYRVEILEWEQEQPSPQERISILKRYIKDHNNDWELMQIGSPTRANIPIMFRRKQIGKKSENRRPNAGASVSDLQ
jgi:hypothetical protein